MSAGKQRRLVAAGGETVTRAVTAWVDAQVRRPKRALLAIAIVTLVLAAGLPRISTEVDLLDVLPPDDPNTRAARHLEETFRSAYSQHVTLDLRIAPEVCRADSDRWLPLRSTSRDCGNITDEVYVRAMDELGDFIEAHPDSPFAFALGAHSFYRLLNWTAEGGEDAPDSAFALPGPGADGETRYRLLHETAWNAVPESLSAPMAHDASAYVLILIPDPDTELFLQQIGDAAIDVLDAWAQHAPVWSVFAGDAPTFYVELAVGDAHSASLVREDLPVLVPAVVLVVITLLWAGFRSARGVAFAGAVLATSSIWVFGAMGWLGLPVTAFNLAVAPLLLGVGIDMSIHMLVAFQAARQGRDDATAFRAASRRAGFAMLLATATTVVGLAVLALAPSPLIGRMALLGAFAIATVYGLSVTLLPALVSATGSGDVMGRAFRPSRPMQALAAGVGRHRGPVAATLLVTVVALGAGAAQLQPEPFGEYAFTFPEDDPYRRDHVANLQNYYDTAPGEPLFIGNILVVQGDMLDPAVHRYIEAIGDALANKQHVNVQALTHLPILIDNYDAARGGIPGAAVVIGQDTLLPLVGAKRDGPESRQEIQEVLDAAFAGPMATFAALFVEAPDYGTSLITFSTATGDSAAVADSWDDVWSAVDEAEALRPEGTRVGFVGNTPTNHIFVTQLLPWVGYLGAASVLTVVGLVFAATRSWRPAALVGALVGGATFAWAGALGWMGFGLSIYLVVPMVFISAIGSDYAVHMVWAQRQQPRLDRVYGVVGKAILFGAATDVAAFTVFAFAQDQPTMRTMVAAAVAVSIMFVLTAVAVAMALPPGRDSRPSARP